MSESIETTTAVSFESSQSTPSIREALEQRDRQAKKERLDFLENAAKSLLTEDEIQECMDNGDMDYSKLEETLKEKGEEETAVELINAVLRMQEEQDESDLRFLSTRLTSLVHCGDLQGKKTKKDKEVLVSLRETRELAWERKGYHRQELEFIGAGIKAYNGGIYALKTVKKNTEERTKHGNTELVERYFVTKALPRLKATTPSVHELPEIIGIKSALGGENYINVMPVDSIGDAEGRKKTPKTILMTTYTSMFFNKAEKLDAEAPQKRVVLYFDRDETRQDITKMSNEEKQAFYADEIKEVVGVFEEFWGVKPYQIHLSRNGYHIVCPISESIGYNDKGLEHALKIASSNPDVASILKKGQEDLRSIFGSRESNELGHADAIGEVYYPIFCSIVSERLREKGLYSDKKNYFDLACRNINRQMVDIGMCNYKEVDSDGNIRVYPIEPVFKELTSVNSKNKYVSLETINFELVNSNQKYILEIANEIIREKNASQGNHLSGKDRVFTANKTEDQLSFIRKNGLVALQKDSFIQLIINNKLELSKEAWWKLAQIIAIFSNPAKSLSEDPAYGLFEKISRVDKYFFKAAYNQDLTFIRACESIMDGDTLDYVQKYTFETIINSEISRNKNLETLKAFARYKENGRREKNRSLFMNAMNEIRSKYTEEYKSSIYDSLNRDKQIRFGLEVNEKTGLPVRTDENIDKIVSLDPLITQIFNYDVLSNEILVHAGFLPINEKSQPSTTKAAEGVTYKEQFEEALAFEPKIALMQYQSFSKDSSYVFELINYYIKQEYLIEPKKEEVRLLLAQKFDNQNFSKKTMFRHIIMSTMNKRYDEWVSAGRPDVLNTYLPEGLHISKENEPKLYDKLGRIGRKLALAHVRRACYKSMVKFELLPIFRSTNGGTGKSSVGLAMLCAIFGEEFKGKKSKDMITQMMLKPFGYHESDTNGFNPLKDMEDEKRTAAKLNKQLVAFIPEIDGYTNGDKNFAAVKEAISSGGFSGVSMNSSFLTEKSFKFVPYASTNKVNILNSDPAGNRRFMIIDLDIPSEKNDGTYAFPLLSKTKGTLEYFELHNKGNGVRDTDKDRGVEGVVGSEYVIDLNNLSKLARLAFGQAAASQLKGEHLNEEELESKDRLEETFPLNELGDFDLTAESIKIEKLELTGDDMRAICEGNSEYQKNSEVQKAEFDKIVNGWVNQGYRILTPAIIFENESYKNQSLNQKEKAYQSLKDMLMEEGVQTSDGGKIKLDSKCQMKPTSHDMNTPSLPGFVKQGVNQRLSCLRFYSDDNPTKGQNIPSLKDTRREISDILDDINK